MSASGVMSAAIKTLRSNRALLKKGGGTYNNFDKSYITGSIISRKTPTYKKATKTQILKIRKELKRKQKELNKRKVVAFAFSLFTTVVIAYFVFS